MDTGVFSFEKIGSEYLINMGSSEEDLVGSYEIIMQASLENFPSVTAEDTFKFTINKPLTVSGPVFDDFLN